MQPKQKTTLTQQLQCHLLRLSCEPQSHLHCGNDPTDTKQNGNPSGTHPRTTLAIPFTLRVRSYSYKSQWNSISNSSTSTTCNPMVHCGNAPTVANHDGFCRPHMHEKTTPHFTMRNRLGHDPPMIRQHPRRSRNCRTAKVDHRGSGKDFVWKKHRVSYICYLSKMHFVRNILQTSIGNSPTSSTCNAICIAGTILQLQITMELHRQLIHQHHLLVMPFTMRNRSEHNSPTHEILSHGKGRSSRFGDGLYVEKHRFRESFVRDRLQKSN